MKATCTKDGQHCRHLFVPRAGRPDWCRKYQVIIDRDERKQPVRCEKCGGVEIR